MFLAGFVLVLHNLTPHVHAEGERAELPDTLADWLEFAFQIDPGAGHLECFSLAEPIDLDNTAMELVCCVVCQVDLLVYREFTPTPESKASHTGDPPNIRSRQNRGPPLFV